MYTMFISILPQQIFQQVILLGDDGHQIHDVMASYIRGTELIQGCPLCSDLIITNNIFYQDNNELSKIVASCINICVVHCQMADI
jgi:hypothetical protein